MSAPIVPGDRDMPEWWTPADDAVLAGELDKLKNLPRPAYVERRMHELVYVPIDDVRAANPSWFPLVAAIVLLCMLLLSLLIALVPSPAAPDCPPAGCATPATFGPGGGRP